MSAIERGAALSSDDVTPVFDLLGDNGNTSKVSVNDAKTWERVRKVGADAVIGDRIRERFDIPAGVTKGLTSPLADGDPLGLPFLVTHLDARLFVEGVVRGRGGRHTDPSPLDDGPTPNTSDGVSPIHSGEAIDRPAKKRAPMTPYDIPKTPPGPGNPAGRR